MSVYHRWYFNYPLRFPAMGVLSLATIWSVLIVYICTCICWHLNPLINILYTKVKETLNMRPLPSPSGKEQGRTTYMYPRTTCIPQARSLARVLWRTAPSQWNLHCWPDLPHSIPDSSGGGSWNPLLHMCVQCNDIWEGRLFSTHERERG